MTERHCIQRRSVFPMLGAGSLSRSRLPRSLRHSMPGAGILRRSRLLLYVGRMEGFGVQGMPCTCDLGRAEEPQQAALRERNQLPRPTLTGRPSCMLWAAATATRRLLAASAMSGRGVVPSRRQSKK